jgi:putative ATPase
MADVISLGSLPVPKHLRAATGRQRRDTGDGMGYRNPHDFEGDDVAQQYLPDALVGRHYYRPSDQGQEVGLAERMAARQAARSQGGRRKTNRAGDSMSGISEGMKANLAARRELAARQKAEAGE